MIDLRFVQRDGNKVLQWRQVRCQIGWSKGDNHPVFQPAGKVSFDPEKNWTDWEDVPFADTIAAGADLSTKKV